jgi:hypothetical protein
MSRSFRIPRPLQRGVALVVAALVALPVSAQDRAVVLVHGLASSGASWWDTAARLGAEVRVQPYTPDLQWKQRYPLQAAGLNAQPAIATIPGRPIAIGHSNGGIVSREWSRIRPLDGIVTIGTPHAGAPLMPQFYNWVVFQDSIWWLVTRVTSAFSRTTNFTWLVFDLFNPLEWVAGFGWWSVAYLAASLGLNQFLDVANDMRPGSTALRDLNSAYNLARESSTVPVRVGISSIAHNFYWAGPFRAFAPHLADEAATILYSAIAAFVGASTFIFLRADPLDFQSIEQAESLLALAAHLGSVDPFYCMLVSSVNGADCVANDGVVPVTSQQYPGAANILLSGGPAHVQQTAQADVLRDVLVQYLHVAQRPAPPPGTPTPVPVPMPDPDPDPDPDPGPAPTPSPSPTPVDPAATEPPPGSEPGGNALAAGQRLLPGQTLWSANGLYEFAYQGDGNLVLYDPTGVPLWASGTVGAAGWVEMQADGVLVIYDAASSLLFHTADETAGHPGAFLLVQDDGNVVVYDASGFPLWHTGTVQ